MNYRKKEIYISRKLIKLDGTQWKGLAESCNWQVTLIPSEFYKRKLLKSEVYSKWECREKRSVSSNESAFFFSYFPEARLFISGDHDFLNDSFVLEVINSKLTMKWRSFSDISFFTFFFLPTWSKLTSEYPGPRGFRSTFFYRRDKANRGSNFGISHPQANWNFASLDSA